MIKERKCMKQLENETRNRFQALMRMNMACTKCMKQANELRNAF